MSMPIARLWAEAPKVRIPESPALLSDTHRLWLAYDSDDGLHAVVQFLHVIDHWLSPINDEGIGKHPYAHAGLKWYSFQEIEESPETSQWRSIGARHWVITFKDNTLDVVATQAVVLTDRAPGTDALNALLSYIGSDVT